MKQLTSFLTVAVPVGWILLAAVSSEALPDVIRIGKSWTSLCHHKAKHEKSHAYI